MKRILGTKKNYESIDVYRSWVGTDLKRVLIKEQQFNEAWQGKAPGLLINKLSEKTLDKIEKIAPKERPYLDKVVSLCVTEDYEKYGENVNNTRWRHQDEAVDKFLQVRHGVLEMATGTGKTRTALKILTSLINNNVVNSTIISTSGTDLLDQWAVEVDDWALRLSRPFRVLTEIRENFSLKLEKWAIPKNAGL